MLVNKFTRLSIVVLLSLAGLGMVSSDVIMEMLDDRPLAMVRKFRPTVEIKKESGLQEASRATQLFSGDTLETKEDGYALVQFMDKSFAQVKPKSMLIVNGTVNNDKSTAARIILETGEVFMNVTQQVNSDYEVATKTSVASVKGTEFGATSDDYYYVLEGIVEILSNLTGETVTLNENMFGQVNDDGSIDAGELSDDEVEDIRDKNEELDEKMEPKKLKLRFRDEDGQIREIEIEYFEN